MNINSQSPAFKMNVKGLDHRYFDSIPKSLKKELIDKAKAAPQKFTIEFIPMKNNFVFLRKIDKNKDAIVDYFTPSYAPIDIINQFISSYIPIRRVLAKSLINEVHKDTANYYYNKVSKLS